MVATNRQRVTWDSRTQTLRLNGARLAVRAPAREVMVWGGQPLRKVGPFFLACEGGVQWVSDRAAAVLARVGNDPPQRVAVELARVL